ncbi:MAG: GNAT family N-acetyltransferase [Rubrivivax sp.]
MSLDPSPPRLRAAAPADLPAIVGLIGELAAYERLQHMVVVTPESLHPHLFGPKPAAEAVVAELELEGEPRIVGFALFFTSFSTFLAKPGIHLEDLYVQPAFRSLGLGRLLLEHLAELAVARGCGRFEWSVLDWNESAIRFYERMGAQVLPYLAHLPAPGAALERYG